MIERGDVSPIRWVTWGDMTDDEIREYLGQTEDDDDEKNKTPKPKSGQHQRRQNATTKRQKALTDKYRMAGRI